MLWLLVLLCGSLAINAQLVEEVHPAPEPYAFAYTAPNDDGTISTREETGDASGRITGFYTLLGEAGQQRRVEYVADENGFRASVTTNEIGTESQNAADAEYISSAPTAAELVAQYGVGIGRAPILRPGPIAPIAPAGLVGAVRAPIAPIASAGLVGAVRAPIAPIAPAGLVGAVRAPIAPIAPIGLVGAARAPIAPIGLVGAARARIAPIPAPIAPIPAPIAPIAPIAPAPIAPIGLVGAARAAVLPTPPVALVGGLRGGAIASRLTGAGLVAPVAAPVAAVAAPVAAGVSVLGPVGGGIARFQAIRGAGLVGVAPIGGALQRIETVRGGLSGIRLGGLLPGAAIQTAGLTGLQGLTLNGLGGGLVVLPGNAIGAVSGSKALQLVGLPDGLQGGLLATDTLTAEDLKVIKKSK